MSGENALVHNGVPGWTGLLPGMPPGADAVLRVRCSDIADAASAIASGAARPTPAATWAQRALVAEAQLAEAQAEFQNEYLQGDPPVSGWKVHGGRWIHPRLRRHLMKDAYGHPCRWTAFSLPPVSDEEEEFPGDVSARRLMRKIGGGE